MIRKERSFCRVCGGLCGMVVSIDEATNRVVEVRGDKSHVMTNGYACVKGLQAPHIHYGDTRLLHPLKRMPDGSFQQIGLEQALDEIAEKLGSIIAESGPRALATFRGTQNYLNTPVCALLPEWLAAFGSPGFYSSGSIDAFSKFVAAGRMGTWEAGLHPIETSDVWMCVGYNPLVSVQCLMGFPTLNPTKRMQALKAAGMKLIVIDPRLTETAQYADIHLQLYPGEDPTLAAGLIHVILRENWHDAEFCAEHVDGLDELRRRVARFTPEYVARRAGVSAESLFAAADLFARQSQRGFLSYCTAPCMVQHSVLATGLYDTINMICGRYRREGEEIRNLGVFVPPPPARAQTAGPQHYWRNGPRSRVGEYHGFFGEMMSNTLAGEIVTPGPGRVRSLFVFGGNPLSALPEQEAAADAFDQLDLLVTVDPVMSLTARRSHYVLPPTVLYERADLTNFMETQIFPEPFGQYTPALVPPPAGSDVVEDWAVLWGIAKRLGVPLTLNGQPLDMERQPETIDLLRHIARNSQVPFDEIMAATGGSVFDVPPQSVRPAAATHGKFQIADPDMMAELDEVAGEAVDHGHYIEGGRTFTHRLAIRRMRDVINSMLIDSEQSRRRYPANPAHLHPDDMSAMGLADGSAVRVEGSFGLVEGQVYADATLKRGVVTMSHCWGGLPGEDHADGVWGANTNRLTSAREFLEPVNAMARMTGIPVNIVPHGS